MRSPAMLCENACPIGAIHESPDVFPLFLSLRASDRRLHFAKAKAARQSFPRVCIQPQSLAKRFSSDEALRWNNNRITAANGGSVRYYGTASHFRVVRHFLRRATVKVAPTGWVQIAGRFMNRPYDAIPVFQKQKTVHRAAEGVSPYDVRISSPVSVIASQ